MATNNLIITIGILINIFIILTGASQAATITVPDDYPKIQWAINNANPGDTILVKSSTYIENIDVNKQLILMGVDTGGGKPVVDGGWRGNAIWISASGVTIDGFNVRNSSVAGISVNSNNNIIKNNIILDNQHGIDLFNSAYNTLLNNNINLNNGDGIMLFNSGGNTISGNTVDSNGKVQTEENGITIQQNSNYNQVTENIANSNGNKGITISESYWNNVSDNIANFNGREGIYLRYSGFILIKNNIVNSNTGNGILLQYSNNNNIIDNNASDSLDYPEGYHSSGIRVENSNDNRISNNTVASNSASGVSIDSSTNNTLINNTARDNGVEGIFLRYSNLTLIENNTVLLNNGNGIQIIYSSYDKIIGNNASNSLNSPDGYNSHGIRLGDSNNITIANNTGFSNTGSGISIRDSKDNLLVNNNLNYNREGILVESSDSTSIENNIALFNNVNGIGIRDSNQNRIIGNNASYSQGYYEGYNSSGIKLEHSDRNIISNNTGISNSEVGIDLYYSNYSTIFNNSLFYNKAGIAIGNSSNNIVVSNDASFNNVAGINVLMTSRDNVVEGNIARDNSYSGISLFYAGENNTIIGNNIFGNGYEGIFIKESSKNKIYDNIISSNFDGIVLWYSSNNTMSGNTMSGNSYNFGILGDYDSEFDQNIDTSNTVDGKPIYYVKNAADQIYDGSTNAGTFYCINCSNVTIRGLTLTKNYYGVFLWKTQNSRIENTLVSNNLDGIFLAFSISNNLTGNNANSNNASGIYLDSSSGNDFTGNNASSNNEFGIYLDFSSGNNFRGNNANWNYYFGIALGLSSGNNLTGNNASNNFHGIGLALSDNNTVTGNNASSNDEWSIYLGISSNNTITGNNASNNYNGILLFSSSNNIIYHNNIINNTNQAYDSDPASNNWYNVTSLEGNYWSDYTGIDDGSGTGKHDFSGDHIGDTLIPHPLIGYDHYPYVYANGWMRPTIVVYTDKKGYSAGNKMYVGLNITNPGSVRKANIYIWIDLPGGGKYWAAKLSSVALPAGLDYNKMPWNVITLPNIPPGNYSWHAVLWDPAAKETISESISPWTFSAAATAEAGNINELEKTLQGVSEEVDFEK